MSWRNVEGRLLCRRHHRAVHEEGWSINLGRGGEVVFRNPRGDVVTSVPPAANPALAARQVAAVDVGEPPRCERLDVEYALWTLRAEGAVLSPPTSP